MSLENNQDHQVSSSSCIHICVTCKKSFSTRSNLGRHMRSYHKDKIFLSAVKPIKRPLRFQCELCNKGWSHKKNFNIHQRKYHGASPVTPGHSCAICKNTFGIKEINQHLQTEHKIVLKYENHEFATFEEFSKWKSDLEKNTRSIYVKYANWKRSDSKCNIYQCHRSGKFYSRSRSKGLRRLKEHGSNKINGYCPASIKLTESEGQYSVSYQTTHVGHQNDLGHLKLSDDEKKFIASKIAAKIPFDKILEDIRDNIPNSGLERIHLLTRKDLQNIVRSLKSGKWAQDIKIPNETLFKIATNKEKMLSQSSIKDEVRNRDNIYIESSFEVYEDEISNESQSESDFKSEIETSYEFPTTTDIGIKVEVALESSDNDDVGNREDLCSESSQEFISNEDEIPVESLEKAAFGNREILCNEFLEKSIGENDGIHQESSEKPGYEVIRIFKHFDQANLSFQERLCNIQNGYLDLINSVTLSEELDVLESNLKSLKSNIDAKNVRKAIVVNLSTQKDNQHAIHSNIPPKISTSEKKHKKKLPENLFRKLRLVQNENEMMSLIMSYKNQSSDSSVLKLKKASHL